MAERDDRIGALLDALGLELDVAEGAELLEPVVDALLEGPPWPRLSQEGARAAEALLGEDDEFRASLRRELSSARDLYPEDVKLALRELERPIPENAVLPDDPAADELWVEFARQVATQELEDLLAAEI